MPERKVLLVGWDGGDWRIARPLMEAGQLPQLSLAVKNGASGPSASLPPYLSPMLWNSMATGKRPHRHGILGFSQVNPATGKVQAVSSQMRRCPAFWNILSDRNLPNHVIGWFASHPAEHIQGVCVSEAFTRPPQKAGDPWPVPPRSVTPPEWADRLADTRVNSADIDQRLLGLFLPALAEMQMEHDRRWEKILYRLAELYTAHNAAVTLLDAEPSWRCLAVYYHFIDWICHDFMEYRPPRRGSATDREVRFYGSVVDAAYRVQDFLLADLLQHAGPDVTLMLVSDHGFFSDHLRPDQTPDVAAGIAHWHRPHGMFVVAGPDIQPNTTLEGVSILDVTPTLLHLLDLPVGEDMDGRALFEVVGDGTRPATLPTWDREISGGRTASAQNDEEENKALLRQFIDLGYIDMPSTPDEDLTEMTERDTAFNLGISLLDADLPAEALPHLWRAHTLAPETPHYAFHVARALAALRLENAAWEAVEVLRDFGEQHPQAQGLLGSIAYLLGDIKTAAQHLEAKSGASPDQTAFENHRGLIALHQNRIDDAEHHFRNSLKNNSDDPMAWLGLSRALLRRDKPPEAMDAARKALSLKRELPLAHLTVAQAAESLGDSETAARAYAEALRFEPNLDNSREGLLRLYPKASNALQDQVLAHLARARPHTPSPPTPRENPATLLQTLRDTCRQTQSRRRAGQTPVEVYSFPNPSPPGSSGKTVSIVSGLPRSGTSMLMQMLLEGGMEPMADDKRPADPDNPRGYFEWEEIKHLARQPDIIEQVGERVVKVVSAQLEHLPRQHAYQVVFVRRPLEEIARSQQAMLNRLQKPGADRGLDELTALLQHHETAVLAQLRTRPEIKVLELNYHDILKNPDAAAGELQTFFGAGSLPRAGNMARAVFPDLHHQRTTS
ncbi:MAG: alkaline phosphatase family protein [Verrucomicrobia bacterium]|nr:alkaline phosphatase family protein [Verrucomicrobiota bacterium]MCH8525683.1 alkaline phosphatase family protein [Kiritimatiellia bacterium]